MRDVGGGNGGGRGGGRSRHAVSRQKGDPWRYRGLRRHRLHRPE